MTNLERKCAICGTVSGIVLLILGLLCAFVIFPVVMEKRLFKHLNIWDQESVGRKNFVRKISTVICTKCIIRFKERKKKMQLHICTDNFSFLYMFLQC